MHNTDDPGLRKDPAGASNLPQLPLAGPAAVDGHKGKVVHARALGDRSTSLLERISEKYQSIRGGDYVQRWAMPPYGDGDAPLNRLVHDHKSAYREALKNAVVGNEQHLIKGKLDSEGIWIYRFDSTKRRSGTGRTVATYWAK